jgi:glutamate-1-semialdehyde 2,1-aminomutase
MDEIQNEELRKRLHAVIPAGCHTFSRSDNCFPADAPVLFKRAEGCYLYDINDNEYLDFGLSLRAVTISYTNKEINDAVIEAIQSGNEFTRASYTELLAAELFTSITHCDMCKFCKNGSDADTACVKLARGYTSKKYVILCRDHPFYSFNSWSMSVYTQMRRGIPDEEASLTLTFNYNDIDSLKEQFEKHKGEIACVVMEPVTTEEPKVYEDGRNFLQVVCDLCHENSSVFILDEIITGFRYAFPCVSSKYNVTPDLFTMAKGISNNFSFAVVGGKREIMELGGINKLGTERLFTLSATHGAEKAPISAFIKTVEFYQKHDVVKHMWDFGKKLKDGTKKITDELNISEYFYMYGFDCSPYYCTKNKNKEVSLEFRTLFMQEMIKHKVLMPWIAICYSHRDKELEITLNAIKKSLIIYKKALEEGIEKYLVGPCIKPVFRKYN